jgi:hypothetical protein
VRVTRTRRVWACGLLLVVALLVVVCGSAHAYTVPSGLSGHEASMVCPPRPSNAPEGATASEVDLVMIAQELADSCYRGEQLAVQAHTDAGAIVTRLGEPLSTSFSSEQTVKVSNLAEVATGGTVEFATPAKDVIQHAPMEATAYLIGALCGFLFFSVVYLFLRSKT